MKSKLKIISKIPHCSGYEGWEIKLSNGDEWSILNFADSMKNHPCPRGIYLGWEGLRDADCEIIRGNSADEIIKQILSI